MAPYEDLTDRQRQIYKFLVERINREGQPPTIREIGEQFGITSTNGVRSILSALIKKGYIAKSAAVSRGIKLLKEKITDAVTLPLVGEVPAGTPLTAEENITDRIVVDRSFVSGGDLFSLRVKGDSMRDAGIHDGDFVLVRKQSSADKGDIVVAVIGDEATVKRFFPERRRIRLMPENEAYGPIIVEKETPGFYIAGKVVGLLRRL
ncbi:MAG: transcriptional repressor LexA [candidate division Zixibacteria bacterium]|nr:transcriptional repressor LexA [candidate division Zixibacteria bacterium]